MVHYCPLPTIVWWRVLRKKYAWDKLFTNSRFPSYTTVPIWFIWVLTPMCTQKYCTTWSVSRFAVLYIFHLLPIVKLRFLKCCLKIVKNRAKKPCTSPWLKKLNLNNTMLHTCFYPKHILTAIHFVQQTIEKIHVNE